MAEEILQLLAGKNVFLGCVEKFIQPINQISLRIPNVEIINLLKASDKSLEKSSFAWYEPLRYEIVLSEREKPS